MRAIPTDLRDTLTQRGAALGYPLLTLDAGYFEGEKAWARLLEREVSDFDLHALRRQLADREEEHAARTAARLPVRPAPDPNAPAGPQELLDAERNADVVREAEYRRSPAGLAERQIALLTEIRDLLQQGRQ